MTLNSDASFHVQFYSWYIYPEREEDLGKSVSSAAYIEDVNQVRFCNSFYPSTYSFNLMMLALCSFDVGLCCDY